MARRRRYSPEEIERGLTALILAGSSREASEVTGIQADTLRDWKRKHPEQYQRLMRDLEPTVVQKIAGESEQLVNRIFGLQRATLNQYEATMHELKPAEAAAASRNLATTSALYVDKHSSPLRERPSHVQQGSDVEALMMRMARLLGHEPPQAPQRVINHANPKAPTDSTAIALPE
jgi:transposase-like protein